MKRTTVLILCLALISLACLTTAGPYWTPEPETPAQTIMETESPAGEVFEIVTQDSVTDPRTCARVIAIEALHLRKGPSETDIILSWLKNNDIVVVVDKVDSNWWRIESGVYVGYVRSIYLQEVECVK